MGTLLKKLQLARRRFCEESFVCFTSDTDWASEYAIRTTLEFFESNDIPATFFITNPSDSIADYRERGRIKCGIHPNFMEGSSQGSTYDEVLDYCFEMLPDARCFRAHRYYDVNDTIEKLTARGILYESNICTLMDIMPPFLHRSNTINFPIFWEDGAYLYYVKEFDLREIKNQLISPGIKVLNIHPMHYMLNTPYFSFTREIKDNLSRNEWNKLDEEQINHLRYEGYGITNYIMDIVDFVKNHDISLMYLDDIYNYISCQII